jgi:hypothetical protein
MPVFELRELQAIATVRNAIARRDNASLAVATARRATGRLATTRRIASLATHLSALSQAFRL